VLRLASRLPQLGGPGEARLGLPQLLHGDGELRLAVHQLPVEVPTEPAVPDELALLPVMCCALGSESGKGQGQG